MRLNAKISAYVSRAAQILVIALTTVVIAELVVFLKLNSDVGLYKAKEQFPPPSGYLLDNNYITGASVPCYLIRVTADGCPYCRLDQAQYTGLLHQAHAAGCELVALAPVAGEMKLSQDGSVVQLKYVDMRFGRVLIPFMTPETILLNAEGQLVWQHEGSIDDPSLPNALHALAAMR